MFNSLSEKLGGILDGLTRRGALSEADVDAALREVRVALLEADVALAGGTAFTDPSRAGRRREVLKSVTPGQMVVKIVHDALVEALGAASSGIDLNAAPPVVMMMVGLQGSGKTTTTAKIALRLADRQSKKVLMASLDVRRPAAQEQLAVLGRQAGVETLPIVAGEPPSQIAKRALETARLDGYDVVILDTAGRTTLDDEMMGEAAEVKRAANPHEILLVADALTGQDAVNCRDAFDERIGLTGIVLTRVDGDGRGGAALSMRAVTGKPIKLIGAGEKLDALEDFDPGRIAGRILGMGDIVGLVESAAETIEPKGRELGRQDAEGPVRSRRLRRSAAPDAEDGRAWAACWACCPAWARSRSSSTTAKIDEKLLRRQQAIITSMTPRERRRPELHQGLAQAAHRRRLRRHCEDVNKLMKQHSEMADMMKQAGRLGERG